MIIMAQKKVSGKSSKSDKKTTHEHDTIYDDFVAKHGAEMRKRTTKTVTEPKKPNIDDDSLSRCGEIDPHTTHNPATQHQIISKRTGRMFSDDMGFKAENYNDRFALAPEMPEISSGDAVSQTASEQQGIPGQQTMAEMFLGSDSQTAVSVPTEGPETHADENPFLSTYRRMRAGNPQFGKSEKLRAIARTATDDAGMEPESQLSFPTFDPLFKFPEEDDDKKGSKKQKRTPKQKKSKKKTTVQTQDFDIDESQIVTSHIQESDEPTEDKKEKKEQSKSTGQFFDFLGESKTSSETAPPYEISNKDDLKQAVKKFAASRKITLIQSAILLGLGIILFIISAVFDSNPDSSIRSVPILYSGICFIFTFIATGVCIKELAEGIKDFKKKKITINTGGVIIIICTFIQCIVSLFYAETFAGNVHLITPAAITSMMFVVLPKLFLTNNSALATSMFASPVSILKPAMDSGIDGALKEKYAQGKNLRYPEKAEFATGLMNALTNAVPKLFGSNAAYLFMLCFALVASIASGIIAKSFMVAVSAFCATVITGIPISYMLVASLALYNTNSAIAKHKSSTLSYRLATALTKTGAIVFNASEITEKTACSIHGIKTFGSVKPQTATLYCAAAINAANSPLSHIMKQVTDQSDEEVPVATNVIVTAFKGIAAEVENNTVLLGSKEFLLQNGVTVPDEDFEEKFITGDRKLLYLAVDGRFTMLLIVSYHIKRSVSALLKYLASKNITPVIYSCDPNVTTDFIAKKCKLPSDAICASDESEGAYLQDKAAKTQPALPADVFTDGSLTALSAVIRSAFKLNTYIEILPYIMYAVSALNVILIAAPMLLGNAFTVSNIYILLIRAAGFAAAFVAHIIISKRSV